MFYIGYVGGESRGRGRGTYLRLLSPLHLLLFLPLFLLLLLLLPLLLLLLPPNPPPRC